MRNNAFTLVEMLVVIAIIGILSGLLFGPLMRAKRNADISACVNQLKNISGAMAQYEIDSKDVPRPGNDGDVMNQTETAVALALLFAAQYLQDPTVFSCPLQGHLDRPFLFPEEREHPYELAVSLGAQDSAAGSLRTHYLVSVNLSRRDRNNKPTAADRAAGDGFTANHGDDADSKGEIGGNVLFRGGNVQTVMDSDGFVPDSLGNLDQPIWRAGAMVVGVDRNTAVVLGTE